jgi:hypothetical protein
VSDFKTGLEPSQLDIFHMIGVPECLHGLMEFAGVRFVYKLGGVSFFLGSEAMMNPTNWILTLPCKVERRRVEIPINDPIDKDDPEGHWRAILGAAADFQFLVNTDQYSLT